MAANRNFCYICSMIMLHFIIKKVYATYTYIHEGSKTFIQQTNNAYKLPLNITNI